ncbi:RNA-binding transcriptional accessory protein [Candidatus Dependentiae bacterium]|nr:RNA-binding transcriptional accessory protein [Candidatus Dependentiae bacterium]
MIKDTIIRNIIRDLVLKESNVKNTVDLFEDGATIPFISRYRKEVTGGLDETNIRAVFEKLEYYKTLEHRKETILKTIESQGKLTPELKERIITCSDKNILEDIYLPYKPKKRTRATIAKEKGLEPLAELIYSQKSISESRDEVISKFINPEKEVNTNEDALTGALDIIAEWISDKEEVRTWLRKNYFEQGKFTSKVKKDWADKKSKFQTYYDFSEPVQNSPSHRILAIRRGEKEGVLSRKIQVDDEFILRFLESVIIKNRDGLFKEELKLTIQDSLTRLIKPSIEKEVINLKIEEGEAEAISVFSKNLKNILLASPAGNRVIMGVDPGYRTGCKVAIIDKKGDFKEFKPIYPHPPQKKMNKAESIIRYFIEKFDVELIAIGDGTASKETDVFIRNILKKHNLKTKSVVVSEAGASVYSASEFAVKEFPDLDVTIRGAISIARRLQDPLAELVKIDPKSIGVGQYQHDVDQKMLKKSLDLTVESCVNFIGVELNTASVALLSYVSGINKTVAQNIVKYRSENGEFKSRKGLKKVAKLGPKAFEQSAGFLRIRNSDNLLDNSAIHPESYHIVKSMAKDLEVSVKELIGNPKIISNIKPENYVTEKFGMPTIKDILDELKKPGLDPRTEFKSIEFSAEINEIKDLEEGMILDGTVTNVTNFGAFVNIGVHQDGLIHISKLSQKFVKNPHEIIAVGNIVKVKVLNVDVELKRISLERIEK